MSVSENQRKGSYTWQIMSNREEIFTVLLSSNKFQSTSSGLTTFKMLRNVLRFSAEVNYAGTIAHSSTHASIMQ